jgi:hypothetical protein
MKLIVLFVAALLLAVFSQSIPTSIISTQAFASKMDGKPYGSSDGGRSNRAKAALKKGKRSPAQ